MPRVVLYRQAKLMQQAVARDPYLVALFAPKQTTPFSKLSFFSPKGPL
uniref:Uncharacterized protein n=1 Tax=Rhizophora mucronata TaxID=61149 RepID=A0A2P2K5W4_RHIMU